MTINNAYSIGYRDGLQGIRRLELTNDDTVYQYVDGFRNGFEERLNIRNHIRLETLRKETAIRN